MRTSLGKTLDTNTEEEPLYALPSRQGIRENRRDTEGAKAPGPNEVTPTLGTF